MPNDEYTFGEMLDTSPAQRRRYYDLLRRLSPIEKLKKTTQHSSELRRWVQLGIANQHPKASSRELHIRMVARLYGREIARRFYGDELPQDAR